MTREPPLTLLGCHTIDDVAVLVLPQVLFVSHLVTHRLSWVYVTMLGLKVANIDVVESAKVVFSRLQFANAVAFAAILMFVFHASRQRNRAMHIHLHFELHLLRGRAFADSLSVFSSGGQFRARLGLSCGTPLRDLTTHSCAPQLPSG